MSRERSMTPPGPWAEDGGAWSRWYGGDDRDLAAYVAPGGAAWFVWRQGVGPSFARGVAASVEEARRMADEALMGMGTGEE